MCLTGSLLSRVTPVRSFKIVSWHVCAVTSSWPCTVGTVRPCGQTASIIYSALLAEMPPLEPETLVLRAGSLGSECTVLCVERVALNSLKPEVRAVPAGFFDSGEHRAGTPLGAGGIGDMLNPLPWDALRVANHFDSRMPEQRTSRKPSARHNGSSQMASLLYRRACSRRVWKLDHLLGE